MTEFNDVISSEPLTDDPRSEARVCAVQAVYQWRLLVGETTPADVQAEFLAGPIISRKANKRVFSTLVEAVAKDVERFQELISSKLNEKWTFDRLDSTMQAMLLVAVAELATNPDIPIKSFVGEYLTTTRAFFEEQQVPFVNGVLDALARQMRPEDFS